MVVALLMILYFLWTIYTISIIKTYSFEEAGIIRVLIVLFYFMICSLIIFDKIINYESLSIN